MKIEKNWKKVFEDFKILEKLEKNKTFQITSQVLNNYWEARLMTKFDHESNLPDIFKNNKLSILPISRSEYVIGNFKTFEKINTINKKSNSIEFSINLESLDYNKITSENQIINCLYNSNILHSFVQETIMYPTVSGRMSSSKFAFNIQTLNKDDSHKILVDNSQLEIDAGFEGENSLILIEAKNHISDDFMVRQLYYPYRLWSGRIKKKIRPIYVTYSNGIFQLREYSFENIEEYNSIILINSESYSFDTELLTIDKLLKDFKTMRVVKEPIIPFPQADSFERIINICELIYNHENCITKDNLKLDFDIDPRQYDYYLNATRYLGLVEKVETGYSLNSEGIRIIQMPLYQRNSEFVRKILLHKVFRDVFLRCLEDTDHFDTNKIVEIMKENNLYNVHSDSTYNRRASTIKQWIKWIFNQIE